MCFDTRLFMGINSDDHGEGSELLVVERWHEFFALYRLRYQWHDAICDLKLVYIYF